MPEQKKRLLICGARVWDKRGPIREILEQYDPCEWIVIHGGANGADKIAGEEAQKLGFEVEVYPADWNKHGRAAGYIRNKEMVELADEMHAFVRGEAKGTRHSIELAHNKRMKYKVHFDNDPVLLKAAPPLAPRRTNNSVKTLPPSGQPIRPKKIF